MADEMPKQKMNVSVFDNDAADHQGYRYTTDQRLSTRLSNERMTRGIREAADFKDKKVLDIGCGDGTFSLELAKLGASTVLGIDPAPEAVRRARDRASDEGQSQLTTFQVENVYDLTPERLGRFDIAVLRGVLHHLPDPQHAVLIAVSLAEEVVILEPNGANPVLKLIEKLSPYHVEHEEQSFLPKTLERWLQEAGAEVQHRQFINLVPIFSPATAARIFKRLEPMVERLPGVRMVATGQYVLRARRAPRPAEETGL